MPSLPAIPASDLTPPALSRKRCAGCGQYYRYLDEDEGRERWGCLMGCFDVWVPGRQLRETNEQARQNLLSAGPLPRKRRGRPPTWRKPSDVFVAPPLAR